MIDIIDRIDDATASVCGWCSTQLTDDNYSGDFCGEAHQECWNWDRAGLTVTTPRTVGVVRHSPAGDAIVLEIAADTSRFENALRMMSESAMRMQAALEARRNRNTGPTHRPRAPKNLGGRTPR